MSIINALKNSNGPVASFAIVGLYWGCFAAHMPVLKEQIGADDATFGYLLLCSGIGLSSSMWLAPRMEGWFGPIALRLVGVLFALTFVLPTLATGPVAFALILIVVGATSGLTDVIMNARVSALEGQQNRPLMSANHGVFSAAYAIAALAAGGAREFGITPPVVFGGLAIIAALLALSAPLLGHEVSEKQPRARGGAMLPVLLCGGLVLVAFMTEATVETWSALHIERTLNGGAAEGALGPATLGIMMTIGRFGGQAISERVRDFTVIVVATFLSMIGVLIAAFAPTPLIAYVGFGTVGLGVSVIGPLGIALVGRLVPKERRTASISQVAVVGFTGFFIAPMLMGQISDLFDLRIAYASVAVFLLLAFPLVAGIRRLPGA